MILCKIVIVTIFAILVTMLSSLKYSRMPIGARFKSRMMSNTRLQSVVNHSCYERLETFKVTEFGFEGALYKHKKSGAQVN